MKNSLSSGPLFFAPRFRYMVYIHFLNCQFVSTTYEWLLRFFFSICNCNRLGDVIFFQLSTYIKKNIRESKNVLVQKFFIFQWSHSYNFSSIKSRFSYKKKKKIVYFDTRGQNGRLTHCKCKNAVSESPVWPHVSNDIFLYKFMRTRVGSPFTDIENAPQLNFTRQLSTRRY